MIPCATNMIPSPRYVRLVIRPPKKHIHIADNVIHAKQNSSDWQDNEPIDEKLAGMF